MQKITQQHLERVAWWFGVPLFAALVTAGPYWMRALALGRTGWMRVPLVGDAVFDTAAYLQPVGHAALGIPQAALIGPFAAVVHRLAVLFPGASVAELWILTQWASAIAAIWVGAWAVRQWSGLPHRASRFISLALWISVALVLGMKPGVFSWFLPMGLFGFGAVPAVANALRAKQIIRAIGWSLAIAAITSVYAWYQLFLLLWLGVTWFQWFALRSWRMSSAWYAVGAVAASAIGSIAGWWVATTEQGLILLQLYERLSLSPTRMPFLSGTVLLTGCWVLLFIPVVRRAVGHAAHRAAWAVAAWITLLLTFLHSPFTGQYIQNDHFRAPAALMSWLSLALVWNLTRSAEVRPRPPSRATRILLAVLLAMGGLYTLRILAAPYAWNGDILNVVHLTHWSAFVFTVALVVRWMGGTRPVNPRIFAVILTSMALVTGGVAWSAVLTREFRNMTRLEQLHPLWSWVREHVPPGQPLCTDHGGDGHSLDDQLSAITGRVVHFAHSTLYHRERNEGYLGRMQTIAGFFDLQEAGPNETYFWQLQATLNRFIVCDQFPWHRRAAKLLGISDAHMDAWIQCPRGQIAAWWVPIQTQIDDPVPNVAAFQKICPVVVIPDRAKPFWRLPDGYVETRVMENMSVWSLK